jgi:hypothetical protein
LPAIWTGSETVTSGGEISNEWNTKLITGIALGFILGVVLDALCSLAGAGSELIDCTNPLIKVALALGTWVAWFGIARIYLVVFFMIVLAIIIAVILYNQFRSSYLYRRRWIMAA